MEEKKEFRSGYCAIVGIPNAGKSTLLNAILKTKLSITSKKPQTTRKRVLGIYSSETEQIVFLDTPGIMPKPSTLLHKAMLQQVSSSFDDADVVLVLADATMRPDKAMPPDWDRYKGIAKQKPIVLAVSKIDLIKNKDDLLPLLALYGGQEGFTDIIPISSKKGHNTDALVAALSRHLSEGPKFFDTEQISDQSERFFVSEFIREKIFLQYGEEIPYSTEVDIREFKEREAGKWYINADIVVERDSQKGILIGKGGVALKKLGLASRKDIEEFLQQPVFLDLHVKTRKDWRNDRTQLRGFGYG